MKIKSAMHNNISVVLSHLSQKTPLVGVARTTTHNHKPTIVHEAQCTQFGNIQRYRTQRFNRVDIQSAYNNR